MSHFFAALQFVKHYKAVRNKLEICDYYPKYEIGDIKLAPLRP